ncbi:MAG: hypothetical protein ABI693_04785 [Bryobacteraceae bacterium]
MPFYRPAVGSENGLVQRGSVGPPLTINLQCSTPPTEHPMVESWFGLRA